VDSNPETLQYSKAEFSRSLAHYLARIKASVLERISSPAIRRFMRSLRVPSFAAADAWTWRPRYQNAHLEFESPLPVGAPPPVVFRSAVCRSKNPSWWRRNTGGSKAPTSSEAFVTGSKRCFSTTSVRSSQPSKQRSIAIPRTDHHLRNKLRHHERHRERRLPYTPGQSEAASDGPSQCASWTLAHA
jgi:hypothetical protein